MQNPPQRPKNAPPRAEAPKATLVGGAQRPAFVVPPPPRPAAGAPPPRPAAGSRAEAAPKPEAAGPPASGETSHPPSGKRKGAQGAGSADIGGAPTIADPIDTTQPQAIVGRNKDTLEPVPPPPNSDRRHEYRAGEIIEGKYQLSRVLGEGGMGAVWLARNITLDVDVAVKLIRRERASPEAAQRLLQEARAAARLGHPSIVRVFDFGESEHNDPYIVMEVLNGESFRDLLARKKRLTPERAVRTLLPIASALVSAHGRGIVHRDLKPDNIILVAGESGAVVPKIVDFGIAKLHQNDKDIRFTLTGQIMGSPGYMSPEQLDGRADIDQRTDVWTFSVVLYEAATGQRPFDGAHYNAMLSAILLRDPVPTTAHGAGDAELWSIISRGLAKDTRERWQSMRDMGAAIAKWALDRGIQNDITGASLAAHWLQPSEGPPSDAPPPDHDVIFSFDDLPNPVEPSKPANSSELWPLGKPPSMLTPIPDTEPAAGALLDPTFPPPLTAPAILSPDFNRPVPLTTQPSAMPAPVFGPRPPMPSYIPLPTEPLEPGAPVVPLMAPPPIPTPPSSHAGSLFRGPLVWIAAFAFLIGIAATWIGHALSRSDATPEGAAPPTRTGTSGATPTSPTIQPASAGANNTRPTTTSGPVPVMMDPTTPSSPGSQTSAAGSQSTDPTGAQPNGTAPGTSPFANPTFQPRVGGPNPTTSGRPGPRPRTGTPMPLPSAPNF